MFPACFQAAHDRQLSRIRVECRPAAAPPAAPLSVEFGVWALLGRSLLGLIGNLFVIPALCTYANLVHNFPA
jgi:hypothetical protein